MSNICKGEGSKTCSHILGDDWSGRVPCLDLTSVNARTLYVLLAISRVISSYLLNRELSTLA